MTHDRIDFSPLDPKRDSERFERMVHKVMQGARVTTGPAQLLLEFLRWGRLGLAAAALIALAVWLPRLTADKMQVSVSGSNRADSVVALVSTWARSGEVPTNVDVIQTLGELDGR
jgi:hypothetical protein